MPNYEIRVESVVGRIPEMRESLLLEEHWQESSKNKHLMVLSPDIAKYENLDNIGNLSCLFAYLDDKLVGYSFNIITSHLHYSNLVCAYNDVLFVSKEHRSSSLGLRLIKATEIECKNRGAKLMLWHAKENTALSKILPKMGCNVQELIFSKEI